MSDITNEITKSLDALEGSLKNIQEEQLAGKISQKAFEDELKKLGDKQLEQSKALADLTQSLDVNFKALNSPTRFHVPRCTQDTNRLHLDFVYWPITI